MTQLIDGGAGDVMIFDERVGGFFRAAQRVPKGVYTTIASPRFPCIKYLCTFILCNRSVLDYGR